MAQIAACQEAAGKFFVLAKVLQEDKTCGLIEV